MFAWPAGSFRILHLCCGRFVEGGASRPARRVQADLGEECEPACHLRSQRVCLHLAHPSMYGTTCPFLMCTAPPARRGRRIHAARELWQGNRPARTKMPLCWQNAREMRSPASGGGRIAPRCVLGLTGSGNILVRCVPECLAVARFHHGVFPGTCRWKNARKMRSRAAISGKFFTPCIPKAASDGKIASSWQHIAAVYPK